MATLATTVPDLSGNGLYPIILNSTKNANYAKRIQLAQERVSPANTD